MLSILSSLPEKRKKWELPEYRKQSLMLFYI